MKKFTKVLMALLAAAALTMVGCKSNDTETFTVTFDANGGTGAPDAVTVTSGGTITAPTTEPTRDNYTFTAWYTDADATAAYDFSTAVTSDFTLYAGWTDKNAVKFMDKDGAVISADTVLFDKDTTCSVSAPTDPTADNLTFAGWYTESTFTNAVTFPVDVTASTTYYAKFTATVTFNTNGISSVDSQIVTYNTTATKPTNPTSDYYTVTWYSESSFENEVDFSTSITGNKTYYAKWYVTNANYIDNRSSVILDIPTTTSGGSAQIKWFSSAESLAAGDRVVISFDAVFSADVTAKQIYIQWDHNWSDCIAQKWNDTGLSATQTFSGSIDIATAGTVQQYQLSIANVLTAQSDLTVTLSNIRFVIIPASYVSSVFPTIYSTSDASDMAFTEKADYTSCTYHAYEIANSIPVYVGESITTAFTVADSADLTSYSQAIINGNWNDYAWASNWVSSSGITSSTRTFTVSTICTKEVSTNSLAGELGFQSKDSNAAGSPTISVTAMSITKTPKF